MHAVVAGDALAADARHVLEEVPVDARGDEDAGGSLAGGGVRLPVASLEVDELDGVAALDLGAVLVAVVVRIGAVVGAEPARPAVGVPVSWRSRAP